MDGARLTVTLRRTRDRPPRTAAGRSRCRRYPCCTSRTSSLALPRTAFDPAGRRRALGRAWLLMSGDEPPSHRTRKSTSPSMRWWRPRRSSSSAARAGSARRPPRRPRPPWPPSSKAAGSWSSPSTRPSGLANALGLEALGNVETRVPQEAFEAAGVRRRGELWAAMLDTKQSWDDLVRRHAPDAETVSSDPREPPVPEHLRPVRAEPRVHRSWSGSTSCTPRGASTSIVIDTPPTRNALDFLEAPDRMADFFSSRLLRLLIVPYRSRLVNLASRPFYQVADRVLGSQFLEDIAEFFILFQTMYGGFVQRARAVERLLHDQRTTFVVVTTLEAAPVRRGRVLHRGPEGQAVPPRRPRPQQGAARRLPGRGRRRAQGAVALGAHERGGARKVAADGRRRPGQVERVLDEVGENFRNFAGGRPARGRPAAPNWPVRPTSWCRSRSSTPTSTTWPGCFASARGSGRRTPYDGPGMATMAELARDFTKLDEPDVDPPAAAGGVVGDARPTCASPICCSSCPSTATASGSSWSGQMRPTTSQTLHREDLVGHIIDARRAASGRPWLAPGHHRRGRGRDSESQRAGPVWCASRCAGTAGWWPC